MNKHEHEHQFLSSAPEEAVYMAMPRTQFSLRALMFTVTVSCVVLTWLFVLSELTAMFVMFVFAVGYALLVMTRLGGGLIYRATVSFLAVFGTVFVGTFLWAVARWSWNTVDTLAGVGPLVVLGLFPTLLLVAALLFRGLFYLLDFRRC